MADRISTVAVVPGLWIRSSTATIITQIGETVFKETGLTERGGYAFIDYHREIPNDAFPLLAEVQNPAVTHEETR